MDDSCRLADDARARVPAMLDQGRLQRALRTLAAAEKRCPTRAASGWALELRALGEIGDARALAERIAEVRASSTADPEVRDLAAKWANTPLEPVDPFASIERARKGRSANEPDWQRHFDRAVVALVARTGQSPSLEAQNGYERGISALAWRGERLYVGSGDIHVLDTTTYRVLHRLSERGRPEFIGLSEDGTRLWSGGDSAFVSVLDLPSRHRLFQTSTLTDPNAVRVTNDAAFELRAYGRSLVWSPLVAGVETPGSRLEDTTAYSADGKWAALRAGTNVELHRIRDYDPSKHDEAMEPVRLRPAFTLRSAEGRNGAADHITFSPDGRRLAAMAGDFDVTVFDLVTRRPIASAHHAGTILKFVFSPDSSRLASAAWDNTARVLDIATNEELLRVEHGKQVEAVAFSPDGERLASGGSDGTLRIVELESRATLHEHAPHVPRTEGLAFADDSTLVTAASDGTVRLWTDVFGEHPGQRRFTWKGEYPSHAVVGPGNAWLAATSAYNGLAVWSLKDDQVLGALPPRTTFTVPSTFFPDRQSALFGDLQGNLHRVALPSGKELWKAQVPGAQLRSLAVSHDQRTIAAGDDARAVTLVDADTGAVKKRLEGHRWMVGQVFFSADDTRLLSRGGDVRLWDMPTGQLIMAYYDPPNAVEVVAFAPERGKALVCCSENKAWVLDLATGVSTGTFDLRGMRPTELEFSPDASWVAASDYWGDVAVWDYATGERRLTVRTVSGIDGGYLIDADGRVSFVGKESEHAVRHTACRFGDLTVDFEVCRDFLER